MLVCVCMYLIRGNAPPDIRNKCVVHTYYIIEYFGSGIHRMFSMKASHYTVGCVAASHWVSVFSIYYVSFFSIGKMFPLSTQVTISYLVLRLGDELVSKWSKSTTIVRCNGVLEPQITLQLGKSIHLCIFFFFSVGTWWRRSNAK